MPKPSFSGNDPCGCVRNPLWRLFQNWIRSIPHSEVAAAFDTGTTNTVMKTLTAIHTTTVNVGLHITVISKCFYSLSWTITTLWILCLTTVNVLWRCYFSYCQERIKFVLMTVHVGYDTYCNEDKWLDRIPFFISFTTQRIFISVDHINRNKSRILVAVIRYENRQSRPQNKYGVKYTLHVRTRKRVLILCLKITYLRYMKWTPVQTTFIKNTICKNCLIYYLPNR